jgi:hypothetical protein
MAIMIMRCSLPTALDITLLPLLPLPLLLPLLPLLLPLLPLPLLLPLCC